MGKHFAFSAAVIVAATGLLHSASIAQVKQDIPPLPATQPAHDAADIPVKEVVLFSSGVGYFEHAGKVSGDVATELRFKTDQVNDILKSLLLQDMDGGTIGTVSYPGLAPLAHMLKNFQVDITANPDMADLLNQLRGAKIAITSDGEKKVTGVILGVEKKLRPAGDKAVVEVMTLNLKVDRQFRSIPLDSVRAMELDDPKLQTELDDALAALVQARDQDKKPMTLHFNGKGERHVRIGYLVETPIWKTSYRLVLGSGDAEKKREPGNATRPTTMPSGPTTVPATASADAAHRVAKIQGWAVVENQTDIDWTDVQLSLVSGRPLSFIQDLYHAQYIPRPVVQADNNASLRPQTYAGGVYDIKDLVTNIPDFTNAPDFSLNSNSNNSNQNPQGRPATQPSGNGLFGNSGGGMGGQNAGDNNPQQSPIDPTSSIISAATAGRVGELFKYRIGNVSLAHQTSAMIPIVTDDIDAERISIYNPAVLPTHPLLGARVKNNTKKYLLQGPVTVLDHGSYAGDARLEDLPPGQERLLSFGIDQQVLMDANDAKEFVATMTGQISKGILILRDKTVMEHTYLADNKSDETRVLVIEHLRQAEFKLVTPAQAEETTPELFRFRRTLAPHKTTKFTVVQERRYDTAAQILPLATANLEAHSKNAALPQKVRDALEKVIQLKEQVATLTSRISEMQNQKNDLSSDQNRVRENLKAVAAESDYYKRLMKKIDEQESNIEKLQKSFSEVLHAREVAEKELNDYVANLTVAE